MIFIQGYLKDFGVPPKLLLYTYLSLSEINFSLYGVYFWALDNFEKSYHFRKAKWPADNFINYIIESVKTVKKTETSFVERPCKKT